MGFFKFIFLLLLLIPLLVFLGFLIDSLISDIPKKTDTQTNSLQNRRRGIKRQPIKQRKGSRTLKVNYYENSKISKTDNSESPKR